MSATASRTDVPGSRSMPGASATVMARLSHAETIESRIAHGEADGGRPQPTEGAGLGAVGRGGAMQPGAQGRPYLETWGRWSGNEGYPLAGTGDQGLAPLGHPLIEAGGRTPPPGPRAGPMTPYQAVRPERAPVDGHREPWPEARRGLGGASRIRCPLPRRGPQPPIGRSATSSSPWIIDAISGNRSVSPAK